MTLDGWLDLIAHRKNERVIQIAAAVARVFGILTILAGGMVLFGGEGAQALAGNVVGFVLWFNFLAGFAYVVAGFGLARHRRWALWLSAGIFVGSAAVLLALGVHVMSGETYEPRTLGAMVLRTCIWAVIFLVGWRAAKQQTPAGDQA
jgi:hypothetical protein